MTRRTRSPNAPAPTLCCGLVVGVGALLTVWFQLPAPQDVGVERVASPKAALPSWSAAAGPESAEREARDVDATGAERVALEHGPSVEAARDIDAEAIPANELEVVVRSNDRDAVGRVMLQRIETNDLATPFDRSLTIEAQLVDGVARFTELPRGVLLLGVQAGSGPPLRTTWVNSCVRGARLDFELGDARIHGWVNDADGAAAAGVRVWITGRQGTVVATSAPDGSYDGGRVLPAGRWIVQVEDDRIAPSPLRRTVDLQPHSVREVSFGVGGDFARWTGRILAPDGSFVTAADGLPANAVTLVARGGRGPSIDVRVVDGAIHQWFERGVYTLRVAGDGAPDRSARPYDTLGRPPDLGRQSAHDALDLSTDMERDVQLAGFVLTGRVEIGGSAATGGDSPFVELRAVREFEALRAEVDTDGTFRFVAIGPGAYELRSSDGCEASVILDERGPTLFEVEIPRE